MGISDLDNNRWTQFTSLWENQRVRQATTLYMASFAGIPLSIFTSIVFTRFLGPQGYGDFAFLDSLFDFARIIFPVGFFYAGNRALVLNKDRIMAREYYGATLVYLFLLFVAMFVMMAIYGVIDPNLGQKGLRGFYFYLLPFGWIFLMTPFFDNMLHADNRIHALAATRFFPKVFTFAAALIIFFLARDFTGNRLAVIWPVYLAAFFLVYAFVLFRIRISFNNLRERMKAIWAYNRSYGIHLYVGSLFSVGSVALTGILISYFSPDNAGVGFFFLAVAIARPLALIPGVIAATWYKDFATQKKASGKLMTTTLLMTLTALVALMLMAGPFIRFFYSDEFVTVVPLVHLAAGGMLLYGLASFYNRFLEAHGRGETIRNTFIVMGLVLTTLNLILIPARGETGAMMAMIISSGVYLAGMALGYYRLIRPQSN